MSQDFKIQQNVKVGNDLINLRADNPDEFKSIAEWTVANAALFVNVQAALAAVPPALAGNVTKTEVHNDPPSTGGWSNQQQQQQQPPSWSGQQQSSQASAGGNNVVEDKWGNRWEYDLPDAPLTPRGPAVMKHAKSREGKPYAKWEDPAAGPRWFSERKPKVETADRWQGSFVNNR